MNEYDLFVKMLSLCFHSGGKSVRAQSDMLLHATLTIPAVVEHWSLPLSHRTMWGHKQ